MQIEQILQLIGLDEKTAQVYIGALHTGKATAFEIAKTSDMKRATVYLKLNELNVQGFMRITKTPKATMYEAESPEKLLTRMEFRKKQLEESLPTLMALYKDKPNKPHIQVLEGRASIEQVYNQAIASAKEGNEVLSFGAVHQFEKEYRDVIDKWLRTMKSSKLMARELLQKGDYEDAYSKRVRSNGNTNHTVRIANEGAFFNDNIIYGNTLAIFSAEEELFVTSIESAEVVNTYRSLFELAWNGAK